MPYSFQDKRNFDSHLTLESTKPILLGLMVEPSSSKSSSHIALLEAHCQIFVNEVHVFLLSVRDHASYIPFREPSFLKKITLLIKSDLVDFDLRNRSL